MIQNLVGDLLNILQSLSPAIIGFLAGILGGILSSLASNYLWRTYKRPVLQLNTDITKIYETDNQGDLERTYYRIQVDNTGNSSALDCQADLHFRGIISEGQLANYEVEVETGLQWQNAGTETITIHQGGYAYIEFLRWERMKGDGFDFPSEQGRNVPAPISLRQRDEAEGRPQPTHSHPRNRIHTDTFKNINWELNEIQVTGELAQPEIKQLELRWNDDLQIEVKSEYSSIQKRIGDWLKNQI